MADPIRVEVVCPLKSHGCTTSGQACNICGGERKRGPSTVSCEVAPGSLSEAMMRLAEAADARDLAEDPFDGAEENVAFFDALEAVRTHPDYKGVPRGE